MKQSLISFLLIATSLIVVYSKLCAQTPGIHPKVEIPNTELRKLTSAAVNQEYQLFVHLPGSYSQNKDKSYPVVYLLDGQYDFPFLTGVYGGQYYDGFLPELIIVGITWGGKDPDAGYLRARDFSPTHNDGLAQSGGGPKFLEFIKKELSPFVASTYRVTDDRTLVGSSFGGLFTLYALFTDPSLFHRYVLTSPSLGWDNGILSTYEKKYTETGSATPVKLFMGIGELEGGNDEFKAFADRLKARRVKNLEFETLVLKNIGHAGTKPEGFARGLQYVFARPSLLLAAGVLNKYTGKYSSEKDTIYVSNEKGKLVVKAGDAITFEAATDKDFYMKGMYLNLQFQTDDKNVVTGVKVDQFGSSTLMKKVK